MFAPRDRLQRVTKAKVKDVSLWREGVNLELATGHTLDELRERTTSDRLNLAADFARRAERLHDGPTISNRDAISRAYYAMYHAWRAVAYFSHEGDDYEEHKKLPDFAPPEFPTVEAWQNRLADARLTRNQADYDAYPKSDAAWSNDAARLVAESRELVSLCRRYLRQRGCRYI